LGKADKFDSCQARNLTDHHLTFTITHLHQNAIRYSICILLLYFFNIYSDFNQLDWGKNMAYLGVACLACSSKRVDSYQAPNGLIIYECDGCGKVWNSNAYKKSS